MGPLTIDSLSLFLATTVAVLSYVLVQRNRQPDVHPSQIRYQADISRTRNKGESAVVRNKLTPHGMPLQHAPSKDVKTAYDMIWDSFRRRATKNYLGYRSVSGGPFIWTTFKQIEESVVQFGSGLLNICGVKPFQDGTHQVGEDPDAHNLVGILMKNSVEWTIVDFACSTFGLVSVPLYPTFDSESLKFVINFTEMSALVATTEELSDVLKIAGSCPKLRFIIIAGPNAVTESDRQSADALNIQLYTFDQIKKSGKENVKPHSRPSPEDVATAGGAGFLNLLPNSHKLNDKDRHLSYLPLCHMFERVVFYALTWLGAEIGFYRGKTELLFDDVLELRPTLFPTVPRLLSRLFDKVTQGVESSGGLKKWLFGFAYRSKLAEVRAGRVTRDSIWDRLVFSKIQARLGGNVRMMLTGAAPISPEILDFLRVVMGCQVLEGYGQTESCASGFVTIVGDYRTFPHVGVPFTTCEYKLVDIPSMNYFATDEPNPRGEICIRGHIVMKSYYKSPELTAEALDEGGWLHTGDVGMIHPDGTLAVIDRVKAQFKLQQGEYVSPERVEIFTKTKWVLQSFVFGDSLKSSCVMIVVPDEAVLLPWAKQNNKTGSFSELCLNSEVNQIIHKSILEEGKKNGLARYELPSAIALSSKTFEELGLLTPTFKTKRHDARRVFADEIDYLYKKVEGK
ncbi:Long-chain-fatty-acid--CoA ligase 1 [Dinochytrium kinnereticum]|nr:Long-chain-fatty-acid--CoA ligase 1 [Dinochytrium kinnereticum]